MTPGDVSVVIPAYNRADLLPRALKSVLAQTAPPLEVLVIDDGSTDDTPRVVAEFAAKHPDVVRYEWKENGGEATARNRGVHLARASFIAFLDSDDSWRPEKLARQVPILERDPSLSATFTSYWLHVDQARELIAVKDWRRDPDSVLRALLVGSCMTPSTVVIRRQVVLEEGGFDERWRVSCDWEFWTRLARRGHRVGYLAEPLTDYYATPDGLSRDSRRIARLGLQIVNEVFADPMLAPTLRADESRVRARWHLVNAICAREAGDGRAARRHLARATRLSPAAVRPGWLGEFMRSFGTSRRNGSDATQ